MMLARVFLGLFAMAIVTGCNDDNSSSDDSPKAFGYCRMFKSLLEIHDITIQPATAFSPGESITFSATIANTSAEPAQLSTGGCNDIVFEVHNSVGQVVWNSEAGIACIAVPRTIKFTAFEQQTRAQSWQAVVNGVAAPVGSYTVLAKAGHDGIDADGNTFGCDDNLNTSARFTIR